MIRIKIKADTVKLKAKGTAIKRAARKVVRQTSKAIRMDANADKPGFVRINQEHVDTDTVLSSNVWVTETGTDMEAYEEFSTGDDAVRVLADRDQEVRMIAQGYFKTGHGTLIGNPYFYPAVIRRKATFVQEMEKALIQELNK